LGLGGRNLRGGGGGRRRRKKGEKKTKKRKRGEKKEPWSREEMSNSDPAVAAVCRGALEVAGRALGCVSSCITNMWRPEE
jgi:hypothetical protein